MFLAFQWVQDVVIMKLGIYLRENHEVIGAVAVMPIQYQQTVVTGVIEEYRGRRCEVLLEPQRPQLLVRPAIRRNGDAR